MYDKMFDELLEKEEIKVYGKKKIKKDGML